MEQLCQRCLEPKHSGECKYSLNTQAIDGSFKYRECPDCKVEIRMTEGKRKVTCSKCGKSICYLCGISWKDDVTGERHKCSETHVVKKLEKEVHNSSCCVCSTICDGCSCNCDGCCNGCCDCECDCNCDCCVSCDADFCCEFLFYCEECSLFCLLWNLLSIPIRLALASVLMGLYLMFLTLILCMGGGMWLFVCFLGALCPIPMELICRDNAPPLLRVLMVLFYPVTVMVSLAIALRETAHIPAEVVCSLTHMYGEMIGGVCVGLSPYNCLR